MIGLSVSFCIRAIADGTVALADVEKIIGGTCVETQDEIDNMVAAYRESYWSEQPDEAEKIFRQMLAEGKIEQPRLKNAQVYPLLYGYKSGERHTCWVPSERHIRWSDE